MIMIMPVKSLVGISFVPSLHRRAPLSGLTIWTRFQPIVGYRQSTPLQTRTRLSTTSRHINIVFSLLAADFFVSVFWSFRQRLDLTSPLVLIMVLKTVYVGPTIQSKSLTELDINLHGSIGVDENGKILFVEREQVARSDKEWLDAEFVHLNENEFFFPGFIGMASSKWIKMHGNRSLT
jgi:hypothetical protein